MLNYRRQSFLLALSDALRALNDPAAIRAHAAEAVGRFLQVNRVGYAELDQNRELCIDLEWGDGTLPNLTGYRSTIGTADHALATALQTGHTVCIRDVRTDPMGRDPQVAVLFERLDIRALLAVPLVRNGDFVAVFYIHMQGPREWTDPAIALAQQVADRTWSEVDRARSDAKLQGLARALEAQVAERARAYDRVWRNSQDLLLILTVDATVEAANPACCTVLGYETHQLEGRSLLELVHPDDRNATSAALASIAHQALRNFENRLRHRDGHHLWLSWSAAAEEGAFFINGRHVTAEREQAQALKHAEQALRDAQKMEAIGQLSGGIAHDFNNLLAGIVGALHMVRRRVDTQRFDDIERFITAATNSANRAAKLTHRLLAFSRRQTLDPKPLDVNLLVGSMAELLGRTLDENVSCETELEEGLWTAEADPNQLENALVNLVVNACDAMPEGGKLRIVTCNRSVDPAEGQSDLAPGDYVVLAVIDTGAGMSADVLAHAFEPFFTTKPIGQGTGLGLSMVYGFAKQSGGHVRIESSPSGGTTINLYIPRFLADAKPAEREGPISTGSEHILVVEDDAAVRMLITEVLLELGYRTSEAADAQTAMPMILQAPRLDLLITDVGLPGMDGKQLADLAVRAHPALRVLFVTGYAKQGVLDAGINLLRKPFELDVLAQRVRELLQPSAD